jgi:bifunctional oligoribonuclease and PAP phosphatase NrnA
VVRSRTKALEALAGSGPFLVTSHRRPDGDALGSMLALLRWFGHRGREAVCVNADGVPEPYTFLPSSEEVLDKVPTPFAARTVVVIDTPDPARVAVDPAVLAGAELTVNIDHHPDNTMFGGVNLVDVSASSAALLVYETLSENLPADPDIAVALYVGIMTDTGCFRFGNTDARTLSACADLARRGAVPSTLATKVYGQQPLGRLRLLGLMLAGTETFCDGRVAVSELTDEMRAGSGDSGLAIENAASYGRLVAGVEVAVLLREETGGIRVSLRSAGEVDVNKVARLLGGGGHKAAAGLMLAGRDIESAKRELLETLCRALPEGP